MPGGDGADGPAHRHEDTLAAAMAVEVNELASPLAGVPAMALPGDKAGSSDKEEEEKAAEGAPEKEKDAKRKEDALPFLALFQYADGWDRLLMAAGTAGAAGLGAALPLLALLFGELTDAFGQNVQDGARLADIVTATALKFVWVALGAAGAAYLEMYCWMVTGERQAARIRETYLKSVLRQEIAFFDLETSTGEVISRMSGDIVLVQEAMGEKVGTYIRLMTTFIGGFAMAFVRGWLLTFIMTGALPFLALAGIIMTWAISSLSSRGQAAYSGAGQVVEQCVGAIRTVVSFTGESKAVQQYNAHLQDAYRTGCRQGLFSGLGIGTTLLVMFSSYALALWAGSLFIANDVGNYTGGKVMSVLFAVIIGGMSLGQASPLLAAFSSGKTAAFRIFEVIARKPKIDVYDLTGETPKSIKGDIEFHNVKFSYPARPDVQIFTDFSMLIPAGKTVALVGESGSGKSTVISLIERFYDPIGGSVMLDGIDLRNIQLRWLRQQIGLVSQEPILFGMTIGENIAYGKDDATEEEIVNAAKMANAHNFISSLPEGYDTQVGERGVQLSGGQKQRVAIARAVVRNPQVLLLDEATSALDAESERVVQAALERVMVQRTTLVVAHRLTTVRNADVIAVLRRGVVVESGTHAELFHKPDGAYAQLVRLQEIQQNEQQSKKSGGGAGVLSSAAMQVVAEQTRSGKGSVQSDEKDAADAGIDDKENAQVPIWRLARLNAPEWPIAIVGSVAAGVHGVMFPVFSILLSSIIRVFYETDTSKLKRDASFWALMFVALGATNLVAVATQTWLFGILGNALIRRIRMLCFSAVLHQEVGWFDDSANSSGAIGARLSTDAAKVRAMVGDSLALLVQNTVTMVTGLVIAFTANAILALVVLSVVPLLGFAGAMQMKALQGFSESAKVLYEDASRVANDAVSSVRTVAAFGAEGRVLALYGDKCRLPLRAGMRRGLIAGLGLGFSNFVLFATYALAFWYGGQMVRDGKTTFEDVFRVFFAIVMSAMGVAQATSLVPDMADVKPAVNSIFRILDRKSEIDADAPGKTLDAVQGNIELSHVKFHYPTRPDIIIFSDLSLSIQAGQTVALVGESGSGKSTVVSLLQRFYDPTGGRVMVDGVDVKDFQLTWLRQQMGLVGQEPVLFNTSIRENIAYGAEGISASEIEAVAKDANAHKFISSLPEGYDTVVGERGVQLSGGQKQRVAIARAIARNPRILLLDEATSALDAESERVVQDALDRVMRGRTTVVVAHRLSTVMHADLIAVVQRGRVAEQGRHAELMALQGGLYAALVKLHSGSPR